MGNDLFRLHFTVVVQTNSDCFSGNRIALVVAMSRHCVTMINARLIMVNVVMYAIHLHLVFYVFVNLVFM